MSRTIQTPTSLEDFQDLAKNYLDWHEKYNADFKGVFTQLGNKANKIQPQEYALMLADGVVNAGSSESVYYITQEGIVSVYLSCIKADGSHFNEYDAIGTLPKGFHPSQTALMVVSTESLPSTGYRGLALIRITKTGEMSVVNCDFLDGASWEKRSRIVGQFSFLAK